MMVTDKPPLIGVPIITQSTTLEELDAAKRDFPNEIAAQSKVTIGHHPSDFPAALDNCFVCGSGSHDCGHRESSIERAR